MDHTGHSTVTPQRVSITTADHRLTFIDLDAYRRHIAGGLPRNYRPTLGQKRFSREELRRLLRVLRGGRPDP